MKRLIQMAKDRVHLFVRVNPLTCGLRIQIIRIYIYAFYAAIRLKQVFIIYEESAKHQAQQRR